MGNVDCRKRDCMKNSMGRILFALYLAGTLVACEKLSSHSKDSEQLYKPGGSGTEREERLGNLSIQIEGMDSNKPVLIHLQGMDGSSVITKKVSGSGQFSMGEPIPTGDYILTTEAPGTGYRSVRQEQTVHIEPGSVSGVVAQFEKITGDSFHYHWESDLKGREYEYSSETGFEHTVEFLDEEIAYSFSSASEVLLQEYNIILSDEGEAAWTGFYATGLLRTVKSIPHNSISGAKFILTDKELTDDILIQETGQNSVVTLTTKAFDYSNPKMVKLDGKIGHFFSRRLFHGLVHFYTDYGKNRSAVRKILQDKFALTTEVPRQVIRQLTGEHWDHYQSFKPRELVEVIMAMAETPEGYYRIPGLRYLLRRRDGQPHPVLKEALAVAAPRGANVDSYIEFMETAFTNGRTRDDVHKTVLHEKSHFLWSNVFSDELKTQWIEIGGWYKNPQDPSGWSTRSTTHFVTAYAHLLDPNEDMVESLAFYIRNPQKLQSVAPEKYEFIEQYVMNGYKYLTQIRSDLQFEVLNLFPDYDYPGKINRVDVYAEGNGNEDKQVTIEIELQQLEGFQTSATHAFMRIQSSIDTFTDLYLYPVGDNDEGHILRGQTTLPKNAKNGYWITQQIVVTDSVGNQRFEDLDDYGFKLFINNEDEDLVAPAYVRESMELSVQTVQKEGREVFKVTAHWQIDENMKMDPDGVYASLAFQGEDRVYSLRKWGKVNTETNQATVEFFVNEYFPTGEYGISYVKMVDRALNNGDEYFSQDPGDEEITTVHIAPPNRDSIPPELDLEAIGISAVPVNPEAPNGETLVNLSIRVRDNSSGAGHISFRLQDPTGKTHHFYFYHNNFSTLFFEGGSPTEWTDLNITVTLPEGSAPGTWGLREIYLEDKGGNFRTHNFVEVIHFQLASSD